MKFSERTRWSLDANTLSRALHARQRPFIDLTLSNPTEVGLPLFSPELRATLASPEVEHYQPEPFGQRRTREALATWLAAQGFETHVDRLCLTASTSEAYAFLFKLLCDPGDTVFVPSPSYPLFEFLAGLESVRLRPYPLHYDGEWHIDLPELDAELETDRSENIRAIVVIHPNNPTGNYLKPDELEGLVQRCAAHGLALISDEVFYEHRLSSSEAPAPRAAARSECLTFSLSGLSKLACLPQLKLGWIAANGPDALLRDALARLEIIADTYLSVSTPVQSALPSILARCGASLQTVRARLETNLRALDALLVGDPPLSRLKCEGGWSTILRLPAVQGSEAWALNLLETKDVLLQPGYFFGLGTDGQDAYVVLSLLCPPAAFSTGVEALVDGVSAGAG